MWDLGITNIWQTWNNNTFASNFASDWGKNAMEALKTFEVTLESRKHKFLSGFPNSKVKGPLIKVQNAWDIWRVKGL